ncbi:uncharacterized protein AMSG_01405 [Thecamonas trahens ATCC 50062]|uniref:Band 7 domain-containing protein n=1 Tax=Thecamonas trahens ATCC 50062 TaxID=461836 RepID=A0A0L0DN10_THETB|nr:hypothetical protein AMSG_01405 [Thecamonas trahens ATCC 50062]KNC53694.1 hypothetical protein AMSG_01405 [Thecamonas trahens ATCC 50062]|eukprot:XP_013762008.1 hypothetical protein AMSG_01405 [Thecamonas trahens ATCC 50062]
MEPSSGKVTGSINPGEGGVGLIGEYEAEVVASASAAGGVAASDAILLDSMLETRYLIDSPAQLAIKAGHSTVLKAIKAVVAGLLIPPPFGWIYAAARTRLVKAGHVGLSTNGGVPELLGPGWHCMLSPLRSWNGQVAVTSDISHGTISVVTVAEGTLGFATDQAFQSCSSYDLSEPIVRIGPYTLVIVRAGTVAVTYDDGKLDIKPPGYHVLRHVRHQARGFLNVTDMFDEVDSLHLLTADMVSLNLDGTVHYTITDARAAALKAGNMDEVRRLVRREAVACITSTVAKSRVNDIGWPAGGEGSGAADPAMWESRVSGKGDEHYAGGYDDKAALFDAAVRTLANIGVRLIKIAIRKWAICDTGISNKLATQSVIRVHRLEKLDCADVDRKTLEIEAEARANALLIEARAAAEARIISAEARLEAGRRLAELDALLGPGHAARLDVLEATGTALAAGNTSTVFVPGTDVATALIGNPGFVAPPEARPRAAQPGPASSESGDLVASFA